MTLIQQFHQANLVPKYILHLRWGKTYKVYQQAVMSDGSP